MRVIIGTILALAVAYGGYWFVGAHFVERGVENWFETQTEEGLIAERDRISVSGFPNRFDVTVDSPRIADPVSGWGWSAIFAQGFMLSYKPNHIIFALPNDQVIETPLGEVLLSAYEMKGSIRLGLDLSPVRTAATAETVRAIRGTTEMVAERIRFGSVLEDGAVHDVALEATGLGMRIRGEERSGGILDIRGKVTLAPPVADLAVADMPAPAALPIDAISITEGVLRFGDIAARVTGDLTADEQGFAAGELLLRMENWPALLDAAVAAGVLPENRAETLEGGFRMMADGDAVEMPLTLANGVVRFGPLPLANAPRLK